MSSPPSLEKQETETILIISREGKENKICKKAISLSSVLTSIATEKKKIDVDISQENLSKILEYLTYHNGIIPQPPCCPVPDNDIRNAVFDDTDVSFVEDLFDGKLVRIRSLLCDAHSLCTAPLISLLCAFAAAKLHGKSLEQWAEMWQISP